MMTKEEKIQEYSEKIVSALKKEVFNENSPNKIDVDDLKNKENFKLFFISLANVVPLHLFRSFTKRDFDSQQFNDLINLFIKKMHDEKENS